MLYYEYVDAMLDAGIEPWRGTPLDFDVEGAAKAGEIGCFNCAHRRATARSGEIVCDYDGINLEEPDMDWKLIVDCWECE